MEGKIKNFKDLRIWQLGIDIVKNRYQITQHFPKNEMFGLISQMRRAALSIPSNIAEGFNRYHNNEYKQFLYIALGSAAELETLVIIAKKLNYCSKNDYENLNEEIQQLCRMVSTLIKKLKEGKSS